MKSSKSWFSPWKIIFYLLTFSVGAILAVGGQSFFAQQVPSDSTAWQKATPANNKILNGTRTKRKQSSNNFVTAAVERVGSAVVRIDTERTVTRGFNPFFEDPFFERFFGDDFPGQMPREEQQKGQGSGLIVDSHGIIITNAHVVSDADSVLVKLKDGRTFTGVVRGIDEVTDLAVVKINANEESLPTASLGDSNAIQVGDWAIAVGNPLGLDNTVTLGIISTVGRSSFQAGLSDKRLDFIQTDAAINPGNSGGPLLNDQGEVIGINTAIRADARGIGFAIPINQVKAVKDQLIEGETIAHPYVGIQMVNLTPRQAQENNRDPNSTSILPEIKGVLVVKVLPNTPAEQAGIRRGDIILEVNGQKITKTEHLHNIVKRSQVGQLLELKIQRGKQVKSLDLRTAQLKG